MKRNEFIKNIAFGFVGFVFPKIGVGSVDGLYSGLTIRNREDGETTRSLTEQEIAYLKLNNAIVKLKPKGYCIDLRYFRKVIEKRNQNYGLD